MKATLNFNLDDPDDRISHLRCVKALDLGLVLWKIVHKVLKEAGHKEDGGDSPDRDWYSREIWDIINDHGIDLDELII